MEKGTHRMTSTPKYLTYENAAAQLDVSKNTLRKMVDNGIIPAVRFSERVVRIRQADLDAAAKELGAP
jgi:excisionase family DNA binding protein